MLPRYQKLIKNSTLFAVSNFGSKVMIFLLMPVYTRTLTTSEMGIADAVYAACTVILHIVSFTISEATMRFSKMEDVEEEKVLVSSLMVWSVSAVIMVFISFALKNFSFFSPYIIFVFLLVISQDFYMIMSQFARGTEKIRIFSESGIIQTLFLLVGNIILLVFLRLGIEGYLIAYIIGFTISGIYTAIRLKIIYTIKSDYIDRALIKKMIRYSAPLIFTGLSWWILNASDKYVILHFIGESANGIYSVAHKIPTIIVSINGFFNSAWQLSAIDEQKTSDNEMFYNKVFYSYSAIVYLISSGIILISRYIMPILITNEYYGAIQYIPILVMSSLFQVFGNFFGGLNIAYRKTKNLMFSAIIAAIVNLGLNVVLTPKFGMYGTAVATCIGCLVMIIIRIIDADLSLYIKFTIKREIKSTALIGLQAFLFWTCSYIGEMLQIIVLLLIGGLYKDFLIGFVKILVKESQRVFHR